MRSPQISVTVNITKKAKETLDRQARERGCASSVWMGHVFDMGFAAVCAREKSMPVSDADVEAIVGATLVLWSDKWNTADMAKGLGVAEPVIIKILDGWREYRRAS